MFKRVIDEDETMIREFKDVFILSNETFVNGEWTGPLIGPAFK